MFDIYSLAKPRVFMAVYDGGGSSTPSETPAPDSVEYESVVLQNTISVVSEEEASEHPEAVGRISASADLAGKASKNVIDAFSDLGGIGLVVGNVPITIGGGVIKKYRTEFRPKQGLHNLDFTTPAETPSDNPGGDAPAQ